jgi:hypothetical protein
MLMAAATVGAPPANSGIPASRSPIARQAGEALFGNHRHRPAARDAPDERRIVGRNRRQVPGAADDISVIRKLTGTSGDVPQDGRGVGREP